jgi:hypothetical protein
VSTVEVVSTTPERPAGASNLLGVAIFQLFALVVPLFAVAAVLASGLARRVHVRRLLELVGAGPAQLRALDELRGALIGLAGAVVGTGLAAGYERAVGRHLDLTVSAVLVPGCVTVVTCALAVAVSSQTARDKLRAARSYPALPRWSQVREELLRGARPLAAAMLVAAVSAQLGEVVGAVGVILASLLAIGAFFLLAQAVVVVPALVPLPTSLRGAAQAAIRARWVTGPAAAAFSLVTVVIVFSILAADGRTSSGDSSPPPEVIGDTHLAAIRASTRSDGRGRLELPEATVRAVAHEVVAPRLERFWPLVRRRVAPSGSASFDDALYVASPAQLEAFGVPPGTLLPGRLIVLGERSTASYPTSNSPTADHVGRLILPITRSRPDWPSSLPHRFVDPTTALRAGLVTERLPAYLVASAAPIDGAAADVLQHAADQEGLRASSLATPCFDQRSWPTI